MAGWTGKGRDTIGWDGCIEADCFIGDGSKLSGIAAGFTDPMTTRGDIIYKDPSNVTTRLGVGGAGTFLGSDGTDVAWDTPTGSGDVSAAANLTDDTIVVGDGGAKGVKTSTATIADIEANTASCALIDPHIADLTNPHVVKLNQIVDPDGATAISMGSNDLKFSFSNPASDGFNIEAVGAYSGDLVHIHQHTGNPGAVNLLGMHAVDTDVTPLFIENAGGEIFKIDNSGNLTLDGTVDGIDVATDVAANTLKVTYDDAGLVALNVASTAINTAKVSYTDAALMALNVASTAINTAKVSYTDAALMTLNVASTAINTAKVTYDDADLVALNVASTAINTAKVTYDDAALVALNVASTAINTAKVTYDDAALVALDVASTALNTTHREDNTQAHTDYLLNSANDTGVGITLTGDEVASGAAFVRNVLIGTEATPPTASTVSQGTLYVEYTA